MHQLDLHVDILYIPNVFLLHRRDTGTTRNASTRYGRIHTLNTTFSSAGENCAFFCHDREMHNSLPRQRMQGLGYNPLVPVPVTNRYQRSPPLRRTASPRGGPLVPVPEATGTKG